MQTIELHSRKYLGFVTLVDDEDYPWLNQYRWNVCASRRGVFYAQTQINGRTAMMHRLILGLEGHEQGDHKDHNGLNNQRYNIRSATNSQNQANRRFERDGLSVHKGVSFHTGASRWRAQAVLDKKAHHLGYFDSEVEAARAYNVFALANHGEFAHLNIV